MITRKCFKCISSFNADNCSVIVTPPPQWCGVTGHSWKVAGHTPKTPAPGMGVGPKGSRAFPCRRRRRIFLSPFSSFSGHHYTVNSVSRQWSHSPPGGGWKWLATRHWEIDWPGKKVEGWPPIAIAIVCLDPKDQKYYEKKLRGPSLCMLQVLHDPPLHHSTIPPIQPPKKRFSLKPPVIRNGI